MKKGEAKRRKSLFMDSILGTVEEEKQQAVNGKIGPEKLGSLNAMRLELALARSRPARYFLDRSDPLAFCE